MGFSPSASQVSLSSALFCLHLNSTAAEEHTATSRLTGWWVLAKHRKEFMVDHKLIWGNNKHTRSQPLHDNKLPAAKSSCKHLSENPQSAPKVPLHCLGLHILCANTKDNFFFLRNAFLIVVKWLFLIIRWLLFSASLCERLSWLLGLHKISCRYELSKNSITFSKHIYHQSEYFSWLLEQFIRNLVFGTENAASCSIIWTRYTQMAVSYLGHSHRRTLQCISV